MSMTKPPGGSAKASGTSDVAEKVKSFGLLVALAFSLFFAIAAPFELYQVQSVHGWHPQQAKVIHVEHKAYSTTPGARRYWTFQIALTGTGETVRIDDVRPGDLPLNAMGWSTTDGDAARYAIGQSIEVYRGASGGKVFLERGSYGLMSVLWLVSVGFLIWLWRRALGLKAARDKTTA